MAFNEKTINYKTWIKHSIVEALKDVFNNHIDDLLTRTKITIEFPHERSHYPAIVVRFYERDISNVGVGHVEYIQLSNSLPYKFRHNMYKGDVELAVYTLSSLDRDLLADSIVQTLKMGDTADYTQAFAERMFISPDAKPQAQWNFITINTDQLMGYGESQAPAPWQPEDTLVYQTSYRFNVLGQFYSLPPELSNNSEFVEAVNQYPYIGSLETIPTGTDDPADWVPDDDLQQPGDDWDTAWPKTK